MVELQAAGDWRAVDTGAVTDGREPETLVSLLPSSAGPARLRVVTVRWGGA